MRRIIPGFNSISQFVHGLPGGMCGLIATLCALENKLIGTPYQMNANGIRALFSWEREHGYCASNGAQNIYSTAKACAALGHAGKLIDYGHFSLASYHTVLKELAGVQAIIVEYANGQALTGDEAGLHYHFEAIGGIDDTIADEGLIGGYACADGDWRGNWPGNLPTPPVWHTWPTFVRAQPIAYIVLPA